MKTYLYIDDERIPKTDQNWIIVRSYDAATSYILQNGIPDYISFDHDLGDSLNGYDIAKWLVNQELDGILTFPDEFEFNVHSANPVGAKNINEYLIGYLKYRR